MEKVTDGKALPKEVLQEIIERGDGVPIFLEELTKTVIETGVVREVNGGYTLALPLGSATLASASGEPPSGSDLALSPGHHDGDRDAPENHGRAGDSGRPDGAGKPDNAGKPDSAGVGGQGLRHGPRELPAQASDRARDAVALAFERQQAIRDRVAQIQAMEPGPGKGEAVSGLMKNFGELFRLGALAADGDGA